jgi:hypothetical protein
LAHGKAGRRWVRFERDHEMNDEGGPPSVRFCADCGAPSPPTESTYALITSAHGWRLTRALDSHGRRVMEWRCRACWELYKEQHSLLPPR